MLNLLRVHLALLPWLWSLWQEGEPETPPGEPKGDPPPTDDDKPTLTQKQLNAIIADEKRKWKESEDKKREAAERTAREDEALKQGEYQKLADERAARLAELEPQVESLTTEKDRALKVIQAQVRELSKDLPEWVKDAIEGKDEVDKFAFLSKHRAAIVGDRKGGPPPSETANGPTRLTREDLKNRYLAQAGVKPRS